jgi:hypothetical protein
MYDCNLAFKNIYKVFPYKNIGIFLIVVKITQFVTINM